MNRSKSIDLFLSLGLVATLGACSSSTQVSEGGNSTAPVATATSPDSPMHGNSPDSPAHTQAMASSASSSQGGEGGEGGSTSEEGGTTDVDYMTTLGLMKGHLLVAKELIAEKQYKQAEPHIGHHIEELYGDLEEPLAAHKVPDFKAKLTKLYDLSKSAPDSPETMAAFDQATQAIDTAIAAVPEHDRQSSKFVMTVINHLLRTAAEEYKAAIADNKIVAVIEYQDSRGFVLYADSLYQTIAAQMSKEKAEKHQVILSKLTELKTTWPSVNPPDAPIKTSQEVFGLIAEIELHS